MQNADRDLVRRDVLPGLETLLDAEKFRELLRSLFAPVNFESVEVEYLRYKPRTNCLAGYRVVADGSPMRLYAKAFAPDTAGKLEKFTAPRNSGGLCAISPELAIGIAFFPLDLMLRHLSKLATPDGTRKLLKPLLGRAPARFTMETLRYKPERRWVGELRTGDEHVVARMYRRGDFRAVQEIATLLTPHDDLRVPELLGFDEKTCCLAFRWIDGTSAVERFREPGSELIASKVAVALARLHAHAATPERNRTAEMIQRLAKEGAEALAWLLPEETSRVMRIAERIDFDDTTSPVFLHGDFYSSQILVTPHEEIAFIDLDEATRGDRWIDVGNFVAHLERDVLKGDVPQNALVDIGETFVDSYASAAGIAVDRDAMRQYTAAALFALAVEPFRYRRDDWPSRTKRILDRVEELLESAPDRARARESLVTEDRALALASEALDPAAATSVFRDLPRLSGCVVTSARIMRHKPSKRVLIEYDVGSKRLLGKIRSKGTDERAFAIQEALWNGGFERDATDGIVVAEPLGVVGRWNMWLQEWLDGETATDAIARGDGSVADRAAAAIAKLHASAIDPGREHTIEDELTVLRQGLAIAKEELGRFARDIDAIAEHCAALLRELRERPRAVIHRDFYPDQLLLLPHQTALVDLDLASWGDPAVDVGNFIAHLREMALRTRGDERALDTVADEFRDCYLARNAIGRDAIEAYEIVSFARHIAISRRIPSRRAFTERIIEACNRLLQGVVR